MFLDEKKKKSRVSQVGVGGGRELVVVGEE